VNRAACGSGPTGRARLERRFVGPEAISCGVFVCIFGGALLGSFLGDALPEHHVSPDSKDVVKLGIGVIGTMTALVLGLLIASAKGTFEAQKNEVTQMSVNVIQLDRILAQYGPETKEARDLLHRTIAGALERMWPAENHGVNLEPSAGWEGIFAKIDELGPRNDDQRWLRERARQISMDLGQMRWLLLQQADPAIPMPFLVVVVFWLTMLFASFGLFAPRNMTVIATQLVCALSVSMAIYLILDLERPFHGLIQISSVPFRNALAHLGQ
jgi:hypothetical protein